MHTIVTRRKHDLQCVHSKVDMSDLVVHVVVDERMRGAPIRSQLGRFCVRESEYGITLCTLYHRNDRSQINSWCTLLRSTNYSPTTFVGHDSWRLDYNIVFCELFPHWMYNSLTHYLDFRGVWCRDTQHNKSLLFVNIVFNDRITVFSSTSINAPEIPHS